MNPYYDQDGITIYHGDCREILPHLPIADMLLTDPPYGVNWQGRAGNHDKIMGDDGSLKLDSWLPLALRQTRRGRHAYIFGLEKSDILEEWPICGLCELIWEKGTMGLGDIESPWGPQHEPILFGVQEISKVNRQKNYGVTAARLRKGSVLHFQRPHSGASTRHPSEKPVDLLRVLIESSSTFGELVLDPFMGSGSTLEAARIEGRRAIGIELDIKHCVTAKERLSGEKQKGLF